MAEKNPKRFSIFKGVYFSHSLKVHIGLTWEKDRFKDPILDLLANLNWRGEFPKHSLGDFFVVSS